MNSKFIDLSEKSILVTGGSSGIGRQTAIQLSELGARLIVVARREDKLLETLELLKGSNHEMVVADLGKLDTIEEVIKKIVDRIGKLHGLVYCAGVAPVRPYNVSNPEFMHDVMQINFFAFFEMVRQFAKRKFSEDGSKIVTISSCASIRPAKGQAAYAASKAAIDASILVLAQELMQRKININCIRPGLVNTTMIDSSTLGLSDEQIAKQPYGIIDPKEIAAMTAYLLSEHANMITGRGIEIEGGALL